MWLAVGAMAAALAAARSAEAMQFSSVPLQGGGIVIQATGPIIAGDMNRLASLAQSLPQTERLLGYSLDSPGGSVIEAEKFAVLVHSTNATVGVFSGAKCASACFLVFAAAKTKLVAPDALIGVHGASDEASEETTGAMAVTTLMSRELAGYGVPPSIIGKLVTTEPGRMEWLMPSDLALLGVNVLPATRSAPSPEPVSRPAPVVNTPQTGQPVTAFDQGLADRRGWETWFNSLSGAYHEGARYWSAQRSLPKPGSCFGPGGQSFGEWTVGCIAAQQRLAATDVRRKSEPEYRQGWNSY
jgi:hypothetical protein